jgi:hypothetical protein
VISRDWVCTQAMACSMHLSNLEQRHPSMLSMILKHSTAITESQLFVPRCVAQQALNILARMVRHGVAASGATGQEAQHIRE